MNAILIEHSAGELALACAPAATLLLNQSVQAVELPWSAATALLAVASLGLGVARARKQAALAWVDNGELFLARRFGAARHCALGQVRSARLYYHRSALPTALAFETEQGLWLSMRLSGLSVADAARERLGPALRAFCACHGIAFVDKA
ncbi:hypothetical protein [Chromobacterium sp.]|uniref:hypothetical protein n=1 Tax=Chromobacterium sp. TaxID=306190 RepID=UPI0035AD78FE